jgi:outer membrane protein assembly factor BamB
MKPSLAVIALACALFQVQECQAQEWPRFRGPNGTGISDSTGVPVEFGPSKNLLWKTAVPFARSSPVIAGNRIFLTASEGDKLITLAIDRTTGRQLWRREIVRPRATALYHENDPASPTPATDGKNVYAFFIDLGLVAYSVEGKELWRVPLGPFQTFYGLAASPIVSGNTVLQLCDTREKAFLIAVDAASGKTRWRVERPQIRTEGYATPVIYEPAGQPAQVITLGPHVIDGYSLATGERLWWLHGVGGFSVSSPLLAKDQVISNVFGAEDDGATAPAFDATLKKLDKDGDGRISREEGTADKEIADQFGFFDTNNDGFIDSTEWQAMLDSFKGDFGLLSVKLGGRGDVTPAGYAWRDKKVYNSIATGLIYQDMLFELKDGGIIASFDAATGKALKAERAKEAMDQFSASPVAADGRVYLTAASCKVVVLKAGAQWEVLGVNDLKVEDGQCNATPAIAGGKIYIRTHGALLAFGAGK